MMSKDRLYDRLENEPGDFVFDERVVRVFPDMINRSVPGYALVVRMLGLLARRYAQDDSVLYDLGCSLGAVALAMSQAVRARRVRIVAVDNAPAMIARLDALLAERVAPDDVPIRTRCDDVLNCAIENASVVALNFTLQFVDPGFRHLLLQRIAEGLRPGGVLLLSEKVCFAAAAEQRLQAEWHHDFKRAQGYSELEIARKRDALENVMQPDSLPQQRQRLMDTGFGPVFQWYQGFNFVSLIAFRQGR